MTDGNGDESPESEDDGETGRMDRAVDVVLELLDLL